MKKSLSLLAIVICATIAFSSREASAVNARLVYTVSMKGGGVPTELLTWGRLVLATISDNQVTNRDTLTNYLCLKPWFSFSNGNKFVCFKSDKQISGGQVSGTAKWHISVFDIPSRTFTDLMEMPANAGASPGYGIVLRWPAGDWIYYHRPQTDAKATCNGNSTGEIWRINSKDPSKKELVVNYFPNFSTLFDPQRGCQYPKVENWHISADLSVAEVRKQFRSEDNWSILHWFPPYAADDRLPDNFLFKDPNCNPGMSPSGKICCCFTNGGHTSATFYQWDDTRKTYLTMTNLAAENGSAISIENFETWSGRSSWMHNFHWPEWAANSDRWLTMQTTTVSDDYNAGANVVFFSMKDNVAINISNNPNPGGIVYIGNWYSSAFIEGGLPNGLQDINGTWSTVQPVEVVTTISSVSGSNPYTLTLTSNVAGADFYYTTDGSEPTQSSQRYAGQASISVPPDRLYWFKAKAFVAGKTPSNSARKRLLPYTGNGAGATCELWKTVSGSKVSDLTSNSRYPSNPDQAWIALNMSDQYGGWWTQTTQGPAPFAPWGIRVRGYIMAPITGSYIFTGIGVSAISVRLSASSDPAGAVEIAKGEWPWYLSGVSTPPVPSNPIPLAAGQWYYMEAVHKVGTNDGCGFNISWQWPTGERETISKMSLMPMDSIPHLPVASILRHVIAPASHDILHRTSDARIYNALGHLVARSANVVTAAVPAGMYFVKYVDGTQSLVRRIALKR